MKTRCLNKCALFVSTKFRHSFGFGFFFHESLTGQSSILHSTGESLGVLLLEHAFTPEHNVLYYIVPVKSSLVTLRDSAWFLFKPLGLYYPTLSHKNLLTSSV